MAWAVFVAAYSLAGGLFLLIWGQYVFFTYPEWYIYGGISLAIVAVCVIMLLALSNHSYIWSRVCFFLWPFLLVISAVRAGLMIYQLNRTKGNIEWECINGGQLWGASQEAGYNNSVSFPKGICSSGADQLYTAFVISLLVDFVCQFYMYFLTWRFTKRLEHYGALKYTAAGMYHV